MSLEPHACAFALARRFPGHRYLATARPDLSGQRRYHAKPQALLDALSHYYANGAANVHRAQHLPGAHATQAFEDSRSKVAQWLNVGDRGQIIFTHGATSALNLLAYGLEHLFQPGR